ALSLTVVAAPARPGPLGDPTAGPPLAPAAAAWQRLLARTGADRWHAAGYRGRGVKVAVLDIRFVGWRTQLGAALPPAEHVTARSFRADGDLEARDCEHGVLCGEILHALAPDAELLLANWEPGRLDQFLAAVRWAKRQGARVLSVSVITPSWSDGAGGGAGPRRLAGLVGPADSPAGLLCVPRARNATD